MLPCKFHGGYHGRCYCFFPGRLPCKFHGGYHEDVLVLFQAGYHGGIIGHNTRKALFVLLILVPGRSQVISLRKSYSNIFTCSCSCSCSCSGKVAGDILKRELY
jgi:hypothetical protein